jgi:outer membrane protein TolC
MKKLILTLSITVIASFGLFAQSINLEQVRVLALANSRSLAKSNMAVQSIALDERSRIFSNLPSLSLGASASMSLWSSDNTAPIENPFDTFGVNANVSVSQTIFDGFKSSIQRAINGIASESARKEVLAEYYSVLDSADTAYYTVLEAVAILEAEEMTLQAAITSLSMAEIRYTAGMINHGDYLRAMAEKETRENSRNQARRNLTLATSRLRALTGLNAIPGIVEIDFTRYEESIQRLGNISDEETSALYDQFWGLLVKANPSLAMAGLANQRAQQNLNMARTGYSPSLSASFSTGLNYSPNNGGLEQSGGRLSLSLSIPVDFWVTNNNVQRSRIAMDSAALDYVSAEINLASDLESSLLNTLTYAGSILSTRRSLEYAERHFEYVMERYRLSQASITDLNDASTLLISSRNNYTRSHYGFLQSLSKLRSLGVIEDEDALLEILLGGSLTL